MKKKVSYSTYDMLLTALKVKQSLALLAYEIPHMKTIEDEDWNKVLAVVV